MKKLLLIFALLLNVVSALAQKTVYIPQEWRYFNSNDTLLYAENDPQNKYTWSKSRSMETDNFIIFWDKGWGSTAPNQLASSNFFYFDLEYMKRKLEEFYDLEINQLGFVDPVNSNVAKYKIMVLLNHTTTWTCYGGGYDFMVPALWLNPATSKPVGHSVAHEVGHSFHYMCFSEGNNHQNSSTVNTGFHLPLGNGQGVWEQTAQWQANQSFPELMFDQSISVFRNSHNYAYTHEWHRYQSYWFFYYLCQYYNDIQTVAKVWNTPMTGATDFNDALMKCKNLSVEDLYRLYYDYASRCATWDFDAAAPYRNNYIGDFNYRCALLDDGSYQVALASCPQATGFNIIPLNVPAAGTEITTHFTSMRIASKLANADPAQYLNGESMLVASNRTAYNNVGASTNRGFRVGYVALLKDGTRQYFNEDRVICKGTSRPITEDVTMTVPENVSRLWLVVVPAPNKYFRHLWDEKLDADDQWPYQFALEGTTLGNKAEVYVAANLDGRAIADVKFTYDVYFPAKTNGDHSGTSLSVSGAAAATLGTAFQLQPAEIGSKIVTYRSGGPSVGEIMFYAASKTGSIYQTSPTANGLGYWYDASGRVVNYGSGYVFSEFDRNSLTFTLGQYPGRCKKGDTYTIGQALRYKNAEGKVAKASFIFNIHITDGQTETSLSSIDYNDPTLTSIDGVTNEASKKKNTEIHDLQGRRISVSSVSSAHSVLPKGVYIMGGRKVIVR